MTNEPGRRQHLQRVPPHDTATEKALLGAALWNVQAAQVVANDVAADDFYAPQHATIATVVAELVAEEAYVDPGTVAAVLRQRGQLDAIGEGSTRGAQYLVHLQADVAVAADNAPRLADMIVGYARKRKVLGLASDVVEAVYSGIDTGGLVAEMAAASEAEAMALVSTWEPVNLASVLAGEGTAAPPTYLARTDGVRLLYPGKIHAFNAEPETGKSMVAQAACAERIREGDHALYIDFEDDAAGVVERLLAMRLSPAEILERFHYLHPEDPVDAGARLRVLECLRAWSTGLVIIDGLAEALALSGWNEDRAPDVMAFYARLPRSIRAKGAACIIIDHLGKDKETQGPYARGSGAKLAAIDGAAFSFTVVKPFGRGLSGEAKMSVTKDRPGFVRASAEGKTVAHVKVASSPAGALTVTLDPPTAGGEGPTQCMAAVEELLTMAGPGQEFSERQLVRELRSKGLAFRDRTVGDAASKLVFEGRAKMRRGARNASLYSILLPEDRGMEGDETLWEDQF